MKKKTILLFFGTRPEAIKMAPVLAALKRDRAFRVIVAVSAQHRHMLDQVLKLFKVRANADLNLMKEGQSLFDVTSGVIKNFQGPLTRFKPDLVLVHGDTTTTLGGALASYYQKIPVGHVEAGLRTHDLYRPFPEEANRRLTDALATLHFTPTAQSRRHLLKENINPDRIFVTGNTVIDALLHTARRSSQLGSPALKKALKAAGRGPLVLMTAHRRENFGRPFQEICQAVWTLAERYPQMHWIYPVHPNPNVTGPARRLLSGRKNVHLLPPLDYADLVAVMKRAKIVVTDSGGLQEEAPSLGKPVVVLREVTERPEAVQAGTVTLAGTSAAKIVKQVSALMNDPRHYRRMATAVNPYGDGRASVRIVGALRWYFGLSKQKPRPFGGRR